MKKVLIINGHPNKDSFCNALTEAYVRGSVAAGHTADVLHVRLLNFNMNLENGYSRKTELEADVVLSQQKITEADHIVIIHPVWWGSVPALLKGFFDRILLPGFAFKYRENSAMWDKLLAGRSGHVIYTSDTPIWFYKLFFQAPSVNMVKRRVLQFCGISPVKVTGIGPLRKSTKQFREGWLNKVEQLAKKIN
jgi:NAD(P)H dehydrogenase (quinone)